MAHAVLVAELEQASRAIPDRPGRELRLRLAGRITHERGEVDHRIEPLAGEQRLELRGDGDVHLAEREVGVGQEVEECLAAEQQRVRRDHAVASCKQLAGHQRTDIAGAAGDQDRAQDGIPPATPRIALLNESGY